jgi:hypothetical protein
MIKDLRSSLASLLNDRAIFGSVFFNDVSKAVDEFIWCISGSDFVLVVSKIHIDEFLFKSFLIIE